METISSFRTNIFKFALVLSTIYLFYISWDIYFHTRWISYSEITLCVLMCLLGIVFLYYAFSLYTIAIDEKNLYAKNFMLSKSHKIPLDLIKPYLGKDYSLSLIDPFQMSKILVLVYDDGVKMRKIRSLYKTKFSKNNNILEVISNYKKSNTKDASNMKKEIPFN